MVGRWKSRFDAGEGPFGRCVLTPEQPDGWGEEPGRSSSLGLGALSINTQQRSQAKGMAMAVAPSVLSLYWELGSKQNALEIAGDRQVIYSRPPSAGRPGAPVVSGA